ncbi:hypothetical protein JCM3770_001474 [Rhodotorula araucariae]
MAPHAVFVSSDLNVKVCGRIIAHGPPGQVDGTQLELDQEDGLTIRYPQLVSVQTRPDEQTLFSINAGERLLTLATPLLPPADDAVGDGDAAAAKKPAVVTLHDGFLPASEVAHLEASPLYSTTFQLLIDGPTFPPPHFDPVSLAPPTPAVRAHDATASPTVLPGGVLNSPTLQRALLSPLLSPQRRAASQGSDASVPPLSLGLSRTSRATADRAAGAGAAAASSSVSARGLAALLAAPGAPAAPTLAGTLTGALSTAAKRTADELVALRRAHDAYVRRAKAELEILDSRVEHFDGLVVAGKGDEGVVRGFKTRGEREERVRRSVDAGGSVSRSRERAAAVRARDDEAEQQRRLASESRSRDRGPSHDGRRSSEERAPASGPVRPGWGATEHASSSNGTKGTLRDEDVSSLIRAQDEREDEERGRSRSRTRRPESPLTQGQTATQRSRSRTNAVAEATAKALEGAQAPAQSQMQSRSEDSRSRERAAIAEGERRGRAHRKGENIPATLEEEEEDADQEGASAQSVKANSGRGAHNGLLSPSAAGAGQPTRAAGASPVVVAHAGHPLVAIPESDESAPPSEAGVEDKAAEEQRRRVSEMSVGGPADDQPFEMDEDVDVAELDLASSRTTEPLESPSLEIVDGPTPPVQQHPSGLSSSFRPGSFQRATALSASYNALLATASPAARASPRSPAAGLPLSPAVTATRAYGSSAARASGTAAQDGTLPPFSPPEAHRPTASSARENAQMALAAATFEHAQLSGGGGARTGPDPRDVRRGEQKIRDVLAMDVPSHRPMYSARRRASVGMAPSAAAYQADDDADSTTSEENDAVGTLGASGTADALSSTAPGAGAGATSKFQVGSLPIALGRPSAVNAALSSWRPDPERLWAQQRERKTSLAQGREPPFVPPVRTHPHPSHAVPTAGGGAALLPVEPPTAPREIGSPETPRPGQGGAGGTGISGLPGSSVAGTGAGSSSSLARSLRNTPASFGRRAESDAANGQQRGADLGVRRERQRGNGVEDLDDDEDEDDEDEDEDEDEDGAFVPPHLVAERRERKDERWLSRSIGSKR